jgi:hypothetical protein
MKTIHLPRAWKSSGAILALAVAFLLAPAPQAHATYAVFDATNFAENLKTSITSVQHKIADATSWARDLQEQIMSNEYLMFIQDLNEQMRTIQDEIMRAAGTIQDIVNIPKNIMNDMFGMVGSFKDTVMGMAGVAGVFQDTQNIFTSITDAEAFSTGFTDFSTDAFDWGKFGSAHGAYRAYRGIQTRAAIEQLENVDRERETVERVIGTFENSDNAAEIAKGSAQITAAVHKEVARANEMQALDVQRQTTESWAKEEIKNSYMAKQKASAEDTLVGAQD